MLEAVVHYHGKGGGGCFCHLIAVVIVGGIGGGAHVFCWSRDKEELLS